MTTTAKVTDLNTRKPRPAAAFTGAADSAPVSLFNPAALVSVCPVFGCDDPDRELLAVSLVEGGKVWALDVLPLHNFKDQDVPTAAARARNAYAASLRDLVVTLQPATSAYPLAGWRVAARGQDADGNPVRHNLDFVRTGLGEDRAKTVVLQHARERARHTLDLSLSPQHTMFTNLTLNP